MSYEEIKSKEVKTRKKHICCWCGELINAGLMAQSRTYHLDGDIKSDHMHPECNTASMKVAIEEGCQIEWMPGDYRRGSIEPI